jgi:hypothetical protein
MDKENVTHIHNGALLSHEEECNNVIYRKMINLEIITDFHRGEKSQSHKDKYCMLSHAWNLGGKRKKRKGDYYACGKGKKREEKEKRMEG